MMSGQKISSIYKSNSVQAVQPTRRLDKYDTSAQSHNEQKSTNNFKSILQKELEKQNKKAS